jgi:hypothetical protein
MSRLENNPLEVKYNDSNNQKFVTIPSSNTDKEFNQIEPGQKIIPVALDKRWNSEYYPEFLMVLELLEEIEKLINLTTDIVHDYNDRKSSGSSPSDLFWLAESLGEVNHDKISKYQRKIEEQFNLHDHDIPAEGWTKSKIKLDHGQQMVEKYEELREEEEEKIESLISEFETIEDFESKRSEVKIVKQNGEEANVKLSPDLEVPPHSEEVSEFVAELTEIYSEREEKFKNFVDELGYEHRLTDNNLGFHQFKYENFVVEVPMCVSDAENIEIYDRE